MFKENEMENPNYTRAFPASDEWFDGQIKIFSSVIESIDELYKSLLESIVISCPNVHSEYRECRRIANILLNKLMHRDIDLGKGKSQFISMAERMWELAMRVAKVAKCEEQNRKVLS